MPSSFDRLSDDVICHILSFLRTKTSASTSVLARRWRFLWTHSPNLALDSFDFRTKTLYSHTVDRIIARHRAKTMNTLRLTNLNCSDYQLDTWIAHAINRCVRNLHLGFGGFGDLFEYQKVDISSVLALPRCLLTCKTLVDAKIECCKGIPSSGEVFFPSLKKLHLSCIVYDDEKSLPHLLSGCPVLEYLIIQCVYPSKRNGDDLGFVFVSFPTIKNLEVDLAFGCHELKINAPSLVCLNVMNCCLEDITSLTTMTSLIEARITLFEDCEGGEEYADTAVQFLNCLCNLEYLIISIEDNGAKHVNIKGLDSVVKFENLTKLELIDLMFDFHELVEFLEVADNLKHLTFTLRGKHNTYREPKQVPSCMKSSLISVRINPFDGFKAHDFESIRYILKNALVLKMLEMDSNSYPSYNSKKEREMLRRIPLLERGSDSCQLSYY